MKRVLLVLGIVLALGLGVFAQSTVLNPYGYPQNWWMGISDGSVSGMSLVDVSGYTASGDASSTIWNKKGAKVWLTTATTLGVTSTSTQDGTYIWMSVPASIDVVSSSASDRWNIMMTGITDEVINTTVVSTVAGTGTSIAFSTTKYIAIYTAVSTSAAVGTISLKYASGLYPTVATIAIGYTNAVLTKGTGAQTVFIRGVDGSYNSTSETVVLKGTETAWTANTFLRGYRTSVLTAGTGLTNAGSITISTGTTVEGLIDIGANQTGNAFYTVPTGYTGFIVGYYISASGASGVSFIVQQTPYIYLTRHYRTLGAGTTAPVFNTLPTPIKVPSGYDVYFNVDSIGAAGVSFTAGFQMTLVKNTLN